jgi:hypothetical protein
VKVNTPTESICSIGPASSLVKGYLCAVDYAGYCMGETSPINPEPDVICLLDTVNSTFTYTMFALSVAVIVQVMVLSSVPISLMFSKSS